MSDNNWNGEGLPSVGQLGLMYEQTVRIRCIVGNNICGSFEHTNGGLCVGGLFEFKSIPNPKIIAKQKAIDEMVDYAPNGLRNGRSLSGLSSLVSMLLDNLYEAGYTKSKVKPLSLEDYRVIVAGFTGHEADYNILIKNGYCIGSAK